MKTQFRADVAEGDEVPDQVMESHGLYVLELDDEGPEGEEHQAAFVVAAWALASLTDGIVFDPQEEFFADADSFWAIITDESLGEDGEPGEGDADDEAHDDEAHDDEDGDAHEHAGGCCSGPRAIGIDLPAEKSPAAKTPDGFRDQHRRNRE